MIYCTASIIPNVIFPSITAAAATTVIIIFLISFTKILPASCICWSFCIFNSTLNNSAWTSSQSQRRRCSQSCNLISCIDVMNSYVLLLFSDCASKSSQSNIFLDFKNRAIQPPYNELPTINIVNINLLYNNKTILKTIKVNIAKETFNTF